MTEHDAERQAERQAEQEISVIQHVEQNVRTIWTLRREADVRVGLHQLFIERLTDALGRPRTLYVVLGAVTLWMAANLGATAAGWHAVDPPPFFWMQGAVGLSALLTTIMVLTTQNRQMRQSERRAHLDLQVNLLSEQKIAKVIALLEELRHDLPIVKDRQDPVAEAMTEAVDPHNVVTAIEEIDNEAPPRK